MVWEAQPSSRRLFYVFRVEAMVIAGRRSSVQMSIYNHTDSKHLHQHIFGYQGKMSASTKLNFRSL
jgi:hypothetical protein